MDRPRRSTAHAVLLGGALLAPAVPLVLARVFEPDPRGVGTHEQLGLEPCAMLTEVGLPCPGCGVTTAVTLAGEGRFAESLTVQPLGLALVLAAALFLPWAIVAHARGRDLWVELRRLPLLWTLAGAVGLVAAAWAYKIARMA